MAAAAEGEESLLYSPTWAIAVTCFVFIAISIFFEKLINLLEHLIEKYRQTSLQAAFHRIKDELMVVGFISIALTLGQNMVAKICVPKSAITVMRLCKQSNLSTTQYNSRVQRSLAAAAPPSCSQDHAPFIPAAGFHQLHIFIFVLALVHIIYSLIIVALGLWSVSSWKAWELKALSYHEDSSHGVRFTKDTTFVRTRIPIPTGWMQKPFVYYLVAFLRQFIRPVSEADYITLRNGFVLNHTPGNLNFDFYKYIRRSLQDDFQHVVGISPFLWLFTCVWLLASVQGWDTKLWTSFIAFVLLLMVGTKLQVIVISMALQFKHGNSLTMGVPMVKPSDELFWLNRPILMLWCMHFILFQNALDLSFVLWIAFSFSLNNCVYHDIHMVIVRLIIGFVTQILCGLVTLPSYALVSQMGTDIKKAMFDKDVQVAIHKWYRRARKRLHQEGDGSSNGRNCHHSAGSPSQSPSHLQMADISMKV